MSIIQKIRDKAAWLVFGLIAVSLIGFLLMDARSIGGRAAASTSGTIGTVNGEKLEYADFQKQVSEREDQYKSQGYPVNDMLSQNIREEVWKQFEENAVLTTEYQKLGIDVSDKELNDMLVGPNAVPEIKRAFTDPNTGMFDAQQAASRINQLRTIYKANRKSDQNYAMAQNFFEQALPQFVKLREREKYISLLAQSSYVPKWMIEKTNADNSQIASVNFVKIPYQTIADSTIKISDAEIQTYLDDHKESICAGRIPYYQLRQLQRSTDHRRQRHDFPAGSNPEARICIHYGRRVVPYKKRNRNKFHRNIYAKIKIDRIQKRFTDGAPDRRGGRSLSGRK